MEISGNQLVAGLTALPLIMGAIGYAGGAFDLARKPDENTKRIDAIVTTFCDEGIWSKGRCKAELEGWEPPAREYRVYSAKAHTERGAVEAADAAEEHERQKR